MWCADFCLLCTFEKLTECLVNHSSFACLVDSFRGIESSTDMRDFTKVNNSFTLRNPLASCDSNNLILYVGQHRDAKENNIKYPKSGILIDSKIDTPSSKTTKN